MLAGGEQLDSVHAFVLVRSHYSRLVELLPLGLHESVVPIDVSFQELTHIVLGLEPQIAPGKLRELPSFVSGLLRRI